MRTRHAAATCSSARVTLPGSVTSPRIASAPRAAMPSSVESDQATPGAPPASRSVSMIAYPRLRAPNRRTGMSSGMAGKECHSRDAHAVAPNTGRPSAAAAPERSRVIMAATRRRSARGAIRSVSEISRRGVAASRIARIA
jgi:hypothetical protein